MSQDTPARRARYERHLMRQRGAGPRNISIDFGFSFDFPDAATNGLETAAEPSSKRIRVCTPESSNGTSPATSKHEVLRSSTSNMAGVWPGEDDEAPVMDKKMDKKMDMDGDEYSMTENPSTTRKIRALMRDRAEQTETENSPAPLVEIKTTRTTRTRRTARLVVVGKSDDKDSPEAASRGAKRQARAVNKRAGAHSPGRRPTSRTTRVTVARQETRAASSVSRGATHATTDRSPDRPKTVPVTCETRMPLVETDANIVRKSASPEKPAKRLNRRGHTVCATALEDEISSNTPQAMPYCAHKSAPGTRRSRRVMSQVERTQAPSLPAIEMHKATARTMRQKESTTRGRARREVIVVTDKPTDQPFAEARPSSPLQVLRVGRKNGLTIDRRIPAVHLRGSETAPLFPEVESVEHDKAKSSECQGEGDDLDWLQAPVAPLRPSLSGVQMSKPRCKRKSYLKPVDMDLDDLVNNISSIANATKLNQHAQSHPHPAGGSHGVRKR